MLRPESATGAHVSSSWTPLPPHSPSHPSGFSQCTGFECIELALVIYFTYGNVHVSMLFSHIIPPSPSPTEPKSLFFISVSLLLSCVESHHYCLSKFHIYINALIYCIRCFSFWLTSLRIIGSSFIHVITTDLNAFFFYSPVILHCVYVPQLPYPFIGRWTSRLNSASFVKNVCCNSFFCLLWL